MFLNEKKGEAGLGNMGMRGTLLISLTICSAIFLFCFLSSACLLAEYLYLCFFIWLQSTQRRKLYMFFAVLVVVLVFVGCVWEQSSYAAFDFLDFKNLELEGTHRNGLLNWLLFSVLVAFWCYVATRNAKNAEKLSTLSTVDSLTEILNRREFFRAALIELNRSQRYGFNMALIMIDIDNFKIINDTYGHVSGDRALRSLADTARHTLRIPDILARYGGEEFVVVMPQTNEHDAILVAERLRQNIAKNVIETREGSFSMTVSIGMTEFYTGEEMLEDAIDRADQALYHAKKTGKNRVCISRQEGEPVTVTPMVLT